jgi:hypothetical protein
MPEFYAAMTGGQFRVEKREAEPSRAQTIQATAAHMNGSLRTALGKRSRRWR